MGYCANLASTFFLFYGISFYMPPSWSCMLSWRGLFFASIESSSLCPKSYHHTYLAYREVYYTLIWTERKYVRTSGNSFIWTVLSPENSLRLINKIDQNITGSQAIILKSCLPISFSQRHPYVNANVLDCRIAILEVFWEAWGITRKHCLLFPEVSSRLNRIIGLSADKIHILNVCILQRKGEAMELEYQCSFL